ncbi:MAG: HD-GYP domain-containing protein [Burkholderiaceae bacterium]|nr:HD-GYP domain-containing protein [Ralstonia sp. LMG 7141]MDE2202433.1 HD-GYP domain-containing protein [Burkholderiaceae bacterium]
MTTHHHPHLLLASLTLAGGLRHPSALGHLIRTACMSARLAERMGLEEAAQFQIYLTAPVHDVGKLGVPDHVLLKPGALSEDEQRIMQRHSSIGADMLGGSSDALLQCAADVARHHHEHFDGTGYPDGLAGNGIPLAARIVAVADAFDAMTEPRVYREGMTEDHALAVLAERSGTYFDPQAVEAFLRDVQGVRRTLAMAGDLMAKHSDVTAVHKFYGPRQASWKFFDQVRAN